MPATIVPAPGAARIGQQLVEQYHQHLLNATILYLFTDQKRRSKGKVVLGSAKKTSPMEQFLSAAQADGEPADFILVFGAEEWFALTEPQRVALVDHELSHCTVEYDEDDTPSWGTRGHDIEEFADVIERHGLWQPDLQRMAVAMEQLRLPIGAEVINGR